MNITINRNGEEFGPYTLDQIKEYLANGTFNESDWAWYEGCTDWVPVERLLGSAMDLPVDLPVQTQTDTEAPGWEPPPPPQARQASKTNASIRIFSRHKVLIVSFLILAVVISRVGWLVSVISHTATGNSLLSKSIPGNGTDSTSNLKNAKEFAEVIFSDIASKSPFSAGEVEKAGPMAGFAAEGMLNPGFSTKNEDIDEAIESLFTNDPDKNKRYEILTDNLPSPVPFNRSILYTRETPDIAVFSVRTSKYFYHIGILFLAKHGQNDRLITLMASTASSIESITGDSGISEKIVAWFKNPNKEGFKSGHVTLIYEPLPHSPIADVFFVADIDSNN